MYIIHQICMFDWQSFQKIRICVSEVTSHNIRVPVFGFNVAVFQQVYMEMCSVWRSCTTRKTVHWSKCQNPTKHTWVSLHGTVTLFGYILLVVDGGGHYRMTSGSETSENVWTWSGSLLVTFILCKNCLPFVLACPHFFFFLLFSITLHLRCCRKTR